MQPHDARRRAADLATLARQAWRQRPALKKQTSTAVPKAMRVQLGRLFGNQSRDALFEARTPAQWKATLRRVLREIDRYVQANVDTDELHEFIIASGLLAADEALKQDDYWPGYTEGLTRVLFTLMGDYPDHRRRKGGARSADHYSLGALRQVQYAQGVGQRLTTLLAAGTIGFPPLSAPPRAALNEFRRLHGTKPSHA